MRLFIAINFDDAIKGTIQDIIEEVKKSSIQGKFVGNEHMHLTLEFLGEIPSNKIDEIKYVMDQVASEPFSMQLSGIGYFKRKEGNIYWLGIEDDNLLSQLQSLLHEILMAKGFELENREYKPHITIGRKVKMSHTFNPEEVTNTVKHITINIDNIDLMKSEQINGKLVHSIVYRRKLDPSNSMLDI